MQMELLIDLSLTFWLRCLRFMSEYSGCLFQGYGVLADPPSKLRTVAKADNFVILDWNNPKRLADTVTTFHVKFRRLGVGDDYLTVEKASGGAWFLYSALVSTKIN